jgi:A/G-specific adenine glycosylase
LSDRTAAFRHRLLVWYATAKRDLPWRGTRDPWRILVSEVMLQQTRVSTVLPYYERFLTRFPDVQSLAAADESEVLRYWAGLGYYSRGRNLQAAAKRIVELGSFPWTYEKIRTLPGAGDYTTAAVSSIAFDLPHAVLDGNVARVLARISAEPGDIRSGVVRSRLQELAGELLDRARPGDFNQALMELGATVCLPKEPRCPECPVAALCQARAGGRERELPILSPKQPFTSVHITLLIVERGDNLLLRRRGDDVRRLAGFWELPEMEALPRAKILQEIGMFRHTIVSTKYLCRVAAAGLGRTRPPNGFVFLPPGELHGLPLSTTARKALACYRKSRMREVRTSGKPAAPTEGWP